MWNFHVEQKFVLTSPVQSYRRCIASDLISEIGLMIGARITRMCENFTHYIIILKIVV